MDFYLNYDNQLKRLINDYEKWGKLVIAYDFDNTVYDYDNNDCEHRNVIELLRKLAKYGHFLCYTCRLQEDYQMIMEYLNMNCIPCDKLNDNIVELDFNMAKKPFYHILLDDRAGLTSAYNLLYDFYHNYILLKEER